MTKRITEYVISAVDEYGDILDSEFCSKKSEIPTAVEIIKEKFPGMDITKEKLVRTFYDDGELKDEEYIDI